MKRTKKLLSVMAIALVAASVFLLSPSQVANASKASSVVCTIDMVVESINNSGVVVGTEIYSKQFELVDGDVFSDDFSTRTRFKFFDASLTKQNGESTVSVDWFADVTVFNSVDFTSSVVLGKGQKIGKTVGTHTMYAGSTSTRTSFALVCEEQ